MMLAVLLAAAALQPPDLGTDALGEMVVTAARPNETSYDTPIALFRRHCFDPLRQTREPAAPTAADPPWQPLGEDVREQLGITDPATILLVLADHVARHRLVLRIDRIAREDGLFERRCTLTVMGGDTHGRAQAEMAALFRGPGTQRHIGVPMGVPRLPGWDQHAWTAMPARNSSTWRESGSLAPRAGGTFLVVTDPVFFHAYDYVLGDLKVRDGDRPITIMSLAVTSRMPLAARP